jgi:predicted amidophosphoribosyltransferase
VPQFSPDFRSTSKNTMSLIKCPACEKDVSPKAPACPHCGEPLKSSVEASQGGAVNMKDPVHFVGMMLVGLIVLGIIVFAIAALS